MRAWLMVFLPCVFLSRLAFADVPPDPRIIADPDDPSWFRRAGGGSYYMCGPGDPEGFFYGTDQAAAIDYLKTTGANCIYVMAVRSHGGDGGAGQNPFVSGNPSLGVDQSVLDQWEVWITALDDAGIVTFFIFYDDSAIPWDKNSFPDEEKQFIDAVVNKFEHHANLMWCVAEEYSEGLSASKASAFAARIKQADDYGHPVAVHQLGGLSCDFDGDANVDQFAVQDNVGTYAQLHADAVAARADVAGQKNVNMAEWASPGTGTALRQKIWAIAMAGAYSMVFYGNNDGDMLAALNGNDAEWKDCGRLVRFMESLTLASMAPRDALVTSGTAYCLANPGTEYACYLPSGGTVSLDLSAAAGTLSSEWYNPRDGTTQAANGGSVQGGGTVDFTSPDSNDWALHVFVPHGDGDGGGSCGGCGAGGLVPAVLVLLALRRRKD